MSSPRIIIIGAGLAGPALALGLARQNIRSTIYERRHNVQDIGGVLMLAPNAVRVLDKVLDIETIIRELGYTISSIGMYIEDSGVSKVGDIGISQNGADSSAACKGLTIKRPVLHNKLIDLCLDEDLIDVQFGKRLKEIEESNDNVTALFEDGSTVTAEFDLSFSTDYPGDILLGVDGIHSKVRDHVMRGSVKAHQYLPRYTGHAVLGGSIKRSELPSNSVTDLPAFIYTQAGTVLMFPTDSTGENLQWAIFLVAAERDKAAWEEYKKSGRAIEDLRQAWGGINAEPVRSMINSLKDESVLVWAPYEIPDLPTWHTDRVCLLGDSCHAISPSAGQGTAQALEDVGLMVRLLSSQHALSRGFPALFSHFERTRTARMEHIKRFTNHTLSTRYPTLSPWMWWAKKMGYKAVFKILSMRGDLRDNTTIGYDVTEENIDVV